METKWKIVLVAGLAVAGSVAIYRLTRSTTPKQKAAEQKIQMEQVAEEKKTDTLEMSKKEKDIGNRLFKEKKYHEAAEAYSRAIALHKAAVYYGNRAACYMNLEEYEKVVSDCTEAISLDKKYTKAFSRRGQAYEKLGRKIDALNDLTVVALLEKFSDASMHSTDRILAEIAQERLPEMMKKKAPGLPSRTFCSAFMESFSRTRNDLGMLANLTITEPGDYDFKEAIDALVSRDYDQAAEYIRKAIDSKLSQEQQVFALNLHATFLFLMGDIDKCLEYLDKALEVNPSDVDTRVKRATIYMEKGRPKECLDEFELLEKQAPNHTDLFYHRGQVKFLAQQLESAAEDYRKVIDLDPEFIYAHIQLGVALYKSGSVGEAQRVFKRATNKFKTRPEVYHYHGEVLADQGNVDGAIELFKKASEMDPTSPLPYMNHAIMQMQFKQDMDSSEKLTRKAIQVDPKCDLAYSHLGQILLAQNRVDEAIVVYEKAMKLARSEAEMLSLITFHQASLAQKHVSEAYPDLVAEIKQM